MENQRPGTLPAHADPLPSRPGRHRRPRVVTGWGETIPPPLSLWTDREIQQDSGWLMLWLNEMSSVCTCCPQISMRIYCSSHNLRQPHHQPSTAGYSGSSWSPECSSGSDQSCMPPSLRTIVYKHTWGVQFPEVYTGPRRECGAFTQSWPHWPWSYHREWRSRENLDSEWKIKADFYPLCKYLIPESE